MNEQTDIFSEQPRATPVVGIGASAGGLEALERFFANVPADAPLAFVVVQHLHAEHPSSMPEILAQRTKLTVRLAEDGVLVEPGHVYVIPANAALTMGGGALRVTSPAEPRRALIDHFFCSLAEDQAHKAIGIILSGAGTDGTIGIKAIKEHGGLAMAQTPSSARYDTMPRSAIALGLVDFVLPVEQMPAKLIEYAAQVASMPEGGVRDAVEAEPAEQIRAICGVLRRVTGHDFSKYKPPTLLRRVQRRMLVLQLSSLAEYVERLRAEPDEATKLFKDLLIGVTQFFRDPEAFEALVATILPRFFEDRRDDRELRVWVPGCATGEEAYSIAILLREAMGALNRAPVVKLFATDIDEHALETARAGRYPEGIADHVSSARLGRFFTKQGGIYQIDKSIREMCIFSVHSLISDPPFSRLDLISCRNLLIYLEADLQKKLVPLFHYALRSGGHLLLGPSENLAGSPELFTTVDKKCRIFRRNDAVLAPQVTFPMFEPGAPLTAAGRTPPRASGRADDTSKTFERVLLANYAPAAVVINERAEILYISGRTGKYFELSPGGASLSAIDMARKGLRPDLHTAIHKAVKTRTEILHENVAVEINGHIQRVNLTVRPLDEIEPGSGLFMIVFQDLGPPISREQAEAAGVSPAPADQLAQALESELRTTREHLRTSVEELESSNEELKSANEELLSTNEELQSTNEEMQTSKEELQSINEELQTVNTELSRKVEELDRANSDLQNLFANTNVATIFLDNDLHIKKFSPEATEIFRILPSDVGRPITDFASPFTDGDLTGSVREVLRTLVPREQQVKRSDGDQWYIQRVRPYRSLDNVIGGAVLTFVEVTALKQAEQRITRLAALVESSQEAIVGLTFDGVISTWNAGAHRVFGHQAEEAVGRTMSLLVLPGELPAVESLLDAVRRGEEVKSRETTCLRQDGSTFPSDLSLSPLIEERGARDGVSMIARDVTERRQREAERAALLADLETERGRLQAIVDHVPFGVALVEAPSGRVVQQNAGAISSHGHRPWIDVELLHPDGTPVEPRCRPYLRSLHGEVVKGEDYLYRWDSGEERWLRVTAAPLRSHDGAITGGVVTFLDIDNEKRAEHALLESDRRKTDFLAVLGHELRNPLTPICNVTHLLRAHEPHDEAFQKALVMIDRQVGHMVRLIDDLLDVSRISHGKITIRTAPVDLAALCHTVLADQADGLKAASVALDENVPAEPVWVAGDAVRLSQVVTNLLSNAVKFTGAGGRVSVEVKADPESGAAIVRVRDTGIGMPKDSLAHVFTPFAQVAGAAEQGGLGLGLAVVKGLVELHGGTVEAASDGEGRGSELTVHLPLSAPPEAPTEEVPPMPAPEGERRQRRVLVIEDNEDISESIQMMLELAGHEVAVASSGADGLVAAAAFRPEIILCDIGLPGKMDGYAVARALRDDPALSSAHRIAMTGYGQDEDQQRALEAGFEMHLTKPVDPERLERLVSQLDP